MKFNEGVWNAKEGVRVVNAVEVSELTTHLDDSASSVNGLTYPDPFIRTICTTRHIRHKGDLINRPALTVEVTSPAPGIIGIEAIHFYGDGVYSEPAAPHFDIAHTGQASVSIDKNTATLFTAGNTAAAVVNLRPEQFSIDIRNSAGKSVTEFGKEAISWVLNEVATPSLATKEHASQTIHDPYYRAPATFRQGYMSAALSLGVGENVYGLGERFGPFIKNGQIVESSNDDGGSSSDSAYKAIPFYMTNRNYGVLVDHLDHVSFEVQSDKMTRVQMSIPGERIKLYVFVGDSPKEVLSLYTAFTGRPPLPPAYSYGLWLSTSFLTDYDEKTVMTYVDGMAKHNIPLNVFHFDAFWMRAHSWCDFQFDPKYFPDPKGFLDRLHKRGLKICVWINPWVGQASRLFKEGNRLGYFVKRLDGRTFQSDTWQPGCSTVDFTNPAARKWWQGYLADLLDVGVDCFKTDFGERITTEGVKWHDGSNPRTMHNAYSLLYNDAVWEVLVQKRGAEEALVFSRSATIGTQRFPVHWGGDVDSKFTGMAETIRGGLSLGLSGFGYHSSDIGGFKQEGKAGGDSGAVPPDIVYKRWCQFGLLSSHSRLHGSGSPRVPWLIDDEACQVLSKFTLLKGRLEPYLTSQSITGVVQAGHPIMRPMFLEFPKDRTAWLVDQQYMLGSELLVAPVFDKSEVDYYLPAGTWTNILNGEEVVGPGWINESHSMSTLPLLLRPDSALIIGRTGHTVLDSVRKRGFTLVIGRGITRRSTFSITLRNMSVISLDVEPKFADGKLKGISVSLVDGEVEFTVLVIGGGVGLDQGDDGQLAHGGECYVQL